MLALEQNEKMFANAFIACSIILLNFWCLLAVLFELLCRINARLYEFLTRLCTVLISLSIAKFSKLYLCENGNRTHCDLIELREPLRKPL